MRNKRADLSLSINAIVILILAITMLGLGLGFIRGMFGKVSTSFDQMISSEPDPAPASAQDPLTLSKDNVIGKANDLVPMKFSVWCFNPTTTCTGATVTLSGTGCTWSITPTTKSTPALTASVPITAILKMGATQGTSICTVTATANGAPTGTTYTKDFVLKTTQ